jgi:ABC-2 type transport system permease protein
VNLPRAATVTRTDLRQLLASKDFLIPMGLVAGFFFVVMPFILLLTIVQIGDIPAIQRLSQTLDALPEKATSNLRGETPSARTAYALAVYLFAPLAVIVPLMISTSVAAASLVGERERGTGEFLAHSPASTHEIYLGKLVASFVPGYFATVVGFGLYSVIVNAIVGPQVGGWFFPTLDWWLLMVWVVPPFLILALSIVLRLSARVRSTAAAQQAAGLVSLPTIVLAYTQSTGALFGSMTATLLVGAIAWVIGLGSIITAMRAVSRSRLLGVGVD